MLSELYVEKTLFVRSRIGQIFICICFVIKRLYHVFCCETPEVAEMSRYFGIFRRRATLQTPWWWVTLYGFFWFCGSTIQPLTFRRWA